MARGNDTDAAFQASLSQHAMNTNDPRDDVKLRDTSSVLVLPSFQAGTKAVVPAKTINSVTSTAEERQATIAGVGEVVPIVYGTQRLGAKITLVHEYFGNTYLLCVWAGGINEEIVSIYVDNNEDIKGTSFEIASYTGGLSQAPDPTLASVLSGYNDNLIISKNGENFPLCYSVLMFPSDEIPSSVQVVLRGLKVYNPIVGYKIYSENPALCLNDCLTSKIYGLGKNVNEVSVLTCREFNNTLLSDGKKQRTINYAIDKLAPIEKHIDVLRTYASCFIVDHGDELFLVPDTVSGTITRSFNEDNFVKDSVYIERDKKADVPTVITVKWTNTNVNPWRDDPATAKLDGVDDGTVEWRESTVRLPGITNYSQAYREAVERLNKLNFSDVSLSATTFDESLQDQIGDIAYFTHRYGLENRPMRFIKCNLQSPGRWNILVKEHADANYSNEVQTEPSEPDTTLPNPLNPNPPTGLILTEDVFSLDDGQTVSKIKLQWMAPVIGFVQHYRVKIVANDELVYETTTTSTELFTTVMRNEGTLHNVSIFTYSGVTYSTDSLTGSISLVGSTITPDAVQGFTGLEAGGKVFLSWSDTNTLQIERYELRYGDASSTWDSGSLPLTTIDGLAYIVQGLPPGRYNFHIKAFSYFYNKQSPTESTVTITITIDSDYLAETMHGVMDEENSTNMQRSYKSRHSLLERYVQADGSQSFAQAYPNNMSTYTNVNGLFYYMEALAYIWQTVVMDFSTELTGVWKGDIAKSDYNTGSQDSLLLSNNNVNFTAYDDMLEDTTARYAKLQLSDSAGKILLVNEGSKVSVNILSIKENGSILSSKDGPKTVGLNNVYNKVINITVTPKIIHPVAAMVDNIVISLTETNHFDIFVFDSNNDLVEVDCFWRFEGI